MRIFFYELIFSPIMRFFRNGYEQVVEINKKYAEPHIKTSRFVKISLLMLRIYLVLLVGILFFKFFTTMVK